MKLGITEARAVVVCPDENREYRDRITAPQLKERGRTVEDVVRSTLKDPERFGMTTPEQLLKAVAGKHMPTLGEWSRYLVRRYGWVG